MKIKIECIAIFIFNKTLQTQKKDELMAEDWFLFLSLFFAINKMSILLYTLFAERNVCGINGYIIRINNLKCNHYCLIFIALNCLRLMHITTWREIMKVKSLSSHSLSQNCAIKEWQSFKLIIDIFLMMN